MQKRVMLLPLTLLLLSLLVGASYCEDINGTKDDEHLEALHFGFQTENGHHRTEDITYKTKTKQGKTQQLEKEADKPVEYQGGYSFISADGYEYKVLYKANKNGFQPYVTAHKLLDKPAAVQ